MVHIYIYIFRKRTHVYIHMWYIIYQYYVYISNVHHSTIRVILCTDIKKHVSHTLLSDGTSIHRNVPSYSA